MGGGSGGQSSAQCIVYSKRTAKLMNSVELRADGKGPGLTEPSNLKCGGDVEAGEVNTIKTGRQRFRWNLIFNLLLWLLIPLPIWLPYLTQYLRVDWISFWVLPVIQGCFLFFWIVVCLLAIRTVVTMFRHRATDFQLLAQGLDRKTSLHHLAVISCYKEPVELIASTIETLANQTLARETTMVVSFEEKTPDLRTKQGQLCDRFGQRFQEIIFTIHPFGQEGEIPGKCSNANCGIRTALAHIKRREMDQFDPERILITTCDADSKFHPRYLEALAYEYLITQDAANGCIFQAPLLYNWKLDELSVITRVTGLVRAFLMMGALIPFNINTMSIFSFSASLCISGDFIHPAYQMDDIIALIRWMGVCKKRIRIVMIPLPILSGPTTGRVIEEEIEEWARQARRWTIGAAEVFHYFVVKSRNIPFLTACSWGLTFFIYYGVILCCSSLYGITFGISVGFILPSMEAFPVALTYFNYASLSFNYVIFGTIFILDRLTLSLTQPEITERISFLRQLFQWILSPFVLLVYSLVELFALHEVMIRGKKVCKHGASKKDNL